jgi:hypothetical protein
MKKNRLFAGFVLLLLTAAFITKAPAEKKASKENCPTACCQAKENSAAGQDNLPDNFIRHFL